MFFGEKPSLENVKRRLHDSEHRTAPVMAKVAQT